MGVGRQGAGEEPIDPGALELPRRQADTVHDEELRDRVPRPGVKMRRQHLPDAGDETGGGIDFLERCWRARVHCCRRDSATIRPMTSGNAPYAARDLAHVWHPCTQMKDHEELPMIPIRRGAGVWLEDYDGKRYLDAISSWWVNLFGHANPRINAAIAGQLEALEQVILAGFTHEPVIALSEALTALAPPGLTRCFYADNGSSAVEVAVKMSFHYWRNC